MPIVIDEVVISINVENTGGDLQNVQSGSASKKLKQQIIEECVEQVMEVLRLQDEP